jgi:hypothetical protein
VTHVDGQTIREREDTKVLIVIVGFASVVESFS